LVVGSSRPTTRREPNVRERRDRATLHLCGLSYRHVTLAQLALDGHAEACPDGGSLEVEAMQDYLPLGLVVIAIWLLVQHGRINRSRAELRHLQSKLEELSNWSFGYHREVLALRAELQSLVAHVTEIGQARRVVEQSATPPVAAPGVEVSPVAVPAPAGTTLRPRVSLEASAPAGTTLRPRVPLEASAPAGATLRPRVPLEASAPAGAAATVEMLPLQPSNALKQAPAAPASAAVSATVEMPPLEPSNAAKAVPEVADAPAETFAAQVRRPGFDWESLIGVRLFSWVAGLSLLLGAIFFLRYSVDSGWLNPPVRMALGFVVGMSLLVACEWKGQHYRVTANAMDAAGIGTLFATSFAANSLWHLVPTTVAFLLLVLVTAAAVLLAIRRQSLFIALLGLVGGFATPILLSTGENRPLGLFGYLLLLNLGLGVVGHRKGWPLLLGLSVALTTLYQWGWVVRFVADDAGQLPIAIGVFLVFPLVWVAMNRLRPRSAGQAHPPWVASLLSVSSGLPLLFAVVFAWVPAFGERFELLFGYLFVLDIGLLVLDHYRPNDRLGPVAAAATLLVWVTWSLRSYSSQAWPLVGVALGLFVGLFLAATLLRERRGLPKTVTRFAASGLLVVVPILTIVEPATSSPFVWFGILLAVFGALAATAIRCRDGWLYYTAVPFVVIAEACWSACYLNQERLILGLLVYLVFALTFIAVPLLARRLARPLLPAGLATVVPLLNLSLLLFLSLGSVAASALWVIGLLIVVLNVGAFIEARVGRMNRAAFVGIGLSWLVVALWWYRAIAPCRLVEALVIVLITVLLSIGGILWIHSGRDAKTPDSLVEQGPLLGLVGHLFLIFVAAQPALNSPPWPLFAIALVLDLALVAASLYLGRALFAALGLGLTVVVLGVWSVAVAADFSALNAAEVALIGVAVPVLLGHVLPLLVRRRRLNEIDFVRARDATTLLSQALLIELGALGLPPRLPALALAQAALLILLMFAARPEGRHWLVLAGWMGACLHHLAWSKAHFEPRHWQQLLLLGLVPYLLLSVYPIFCNARKGLRRGPFGIAVCGSLGFFFAGSCALDSGPLGAYIGGLPLVESLVMSGLLLYLLRVVEPNPPRDIGRLALVAAVALGFATTAIPLQLKNEWLTVAWALEVAVLGWLYHRLRHSGLIAGSLGLAIAVVARLAANPAVFAYHERSNAPILNFYLYAYLVSAAALYLASWFLRDAVEPRYGWLQKTAWTQRAFATILLFVLLNIEIADFYSEGPTIVFRFSSTLAQDLTYTLGWALFAIAMLVVGILVRGRATRIAALLLLTVTMAKCFLHDLWRLGGLYRVGSFVGLALCLAMVAILLQRFVLKPTSPERNS
jgi:hypothetical protein